MFNNEMEVESDIFTPRELTDQGKNEDIMLQCKLYNKSVVAFRYKEDIVVLFDNDRECKELCEIARSILETNCTLQLVLL